MNRLAGEPSAYLRQHAKNPVNWQPFDDAAFAEAEARDVPVFLSVGYAACHWCHVMAGESFEDPAVGAYLNEHFVSIKVDREERPDVDDAYMAATQALSGQGGWPMSVFLTPAGKAFYAGTYFPPQPGPGRPSFRQVLEAVEEAWRVRREQLLETADTLAQALAQPMWQVRAAAQAGAAVGPQGAVAVAAEPESNWLEPAGQALSAMLRAEDPVHGGLGQAPKFPPTPGLDFLIRHAASGAASAAQARGLAGRTLGAMVHSALFDQLAGGFARYSVTADWSEPHYEKMLYDNAGLLQVLVRWIRLLADSRVQPDDGATPSAAVAPLAADDARDAVRSTVAWLLAEMRLPGGAFASSLDADTVVGGVHHEGASYQWTLAELQAAARGVVADVDDAKALAAAVAGFMGVAAGSGAGAADQDAPRPFHPGRPLTAGERAQWRRIKPALLEMRAGRVMPARDEKVVAGWNALLMGALAEAAMVLEEPAWLAAAVELGEYLHGVHWDGALSRVSHEGRARGIKGLLEDYAACANAYLTLYAATGEVRWFDFAGELLRAAEAEFIAGGVVFNHGAAEGADDSGSAGPLHGPRHADPFDNATAGGAPLLAEALIAWSAYTGSARHRAMAESMLATVPDLAARAPRSAGGMLGAGLVLAAGPLEAAIVGAPGEPRESLVRAAWQSASPGLVIAVWDGKGLAPVPLLEGRSVAERGTSELGWAEVPAPGSAGAPGPPPLAYVCRNMVCARPVATVDGLQELLH